MKKIKWHKFFIVGLFIWLTNALASVKFNRVATIGLVLLLSLLFVGCGSNCSRTKRYWKKYRAVDVETKKDVIPTYKSSGRIAMR